MPVDDIDQDFEDGVEAGDDLGGRARPRGGGEVADVDKHHADPPHFAQFRGADRKQPLDHPRRDVLAEQIGQFVSRRHSGERAREMALDCRPDEAGQKARRKQDRAARQMIADVEVEVPGSPAERQNEQGKREKLDGGDRAREGRKPEIEPQRRENDEQKIKRDRPGAEDGGGAATYPARR